MVTRDEIEVRYAALRHAMQEAGYDALVVAGAPFGSGRGYLRWLSDWYLYSGTSYVVFPLVQEPTIIFGLGSAGEWGRDLSLIPDGRVVLDKNAEAVNFLQAAGLSRGRIGVVGFRDIITHGDAQALLTGLPDARMDDATTLMQELVQVLTPADIARVEETHSLLAQVFLRIKEAMAPGKTEREVMAEAHYLAAKLGCNDLRATLTNALGMATRPPSDRVIVPEDIIKIYLDSSGRSGYCVELGGPISLQEPPDEVRRKYLTTVKSIQRAAEMMRPGAVAGDIVEVIEQTYREDGWPITGRRLWDFHGQGIVGHLPPDGLPGATGTLKENTMINIHPGLLTGGWEGQVTYNYIVTANGGRPLCGYQPEWHIAGA